MVVMKKVLWVVAFGLLVLIGALTVGAVGGFFDTWMKSEVLPKATTQTMDQQLAKAIESIDSQLSQTRNGNEIGLHSVAMAPDRTVVWRFRVDREVPAERLDHLFAMNRDRVCAGNLRRFLDAGYVFSYEYRGEKSSYGVKVRGADCDK